MPTYRGVLIGAGGFAGAWARRFLPQVRERVEIVGIADINTVALHESADVLGVPQDGRFTSYASMLETVEADLCFIVIQPGLRTEPIRMAAERGMSILVEKPLAASWEQALEIGQVIREHDIKFAVMQNYRQTNRIRALKAVLDRPEMGAINTVQCRMAVNYTIETAGGAFRHGKPDAFIFEGAEHHIDQARNLTGADGAWVLGAQWGQPWSTFEGSVCLALIMGMTNGSVVQFEMNHIDRGHQNGWHEEYYRVNAEGGTVTLDADHLVRITRDTADGEEVEEVIPAADPLDGHHAVIAAFLDWVDGGPPPETVLDDVLQTMALTFSAADATHSGQREDVQSRIDALPAALRPRVMAGER